MREKFYKDGIRFKCQGLGKCCKSRNSDGYVYLTLKDRQNIASYLGVSTRQFTQRYTAKTKNKFHFKQIHPQCPFLKDNRCSIYEVRPLQCHTWPFWPENMKEKVWKQKIKLYCLGIGKGKLYSAREIDKFINDQNKNPTLEGTVLE